MCVIDDEKWKAMTIDVRLEMLLSEMKAIRVVRIPRESGIKYEPYSCEMRLGFMGVFNTYDEARNAGIAYCLNKLNDIGLIKVFLDET